MILGDTLIYKCPYCNNLFSKQTYLSCNNFGDSLYSNACYMNNPPFIDLYKCRLCKKFLWKEQIEYIGVIESEESYWFLDFIKIEDKKEIPDEWNHTQYINAHDLTMSDLKTVLDGDLIINLEQEISIRKYIWRKFNNKVCFNFSLNNFQSDENFYTDNIEILTKVLDLDIIENKFILAEIARNKGEFDTCLSQIATIEDSSCDYIINRFIEECNKKNRKLFII